MKRFISYVLCLVMLMCLCACKQGHDQPDDSNPAVTTPEFEPSREGLAINPYATVELPVTFDVYNNVYAKNVMPAAEGIDIVLPVTSILPGRSLEAIVQVDDQNIHVAAAVDSVGNYVVWYGVCQECIETGMSTHPQIVHEGESAIVCNGCGKLFKMSDLARGNSDKSDRCAPYVIDPTRYQVKKVKDCNLQMDAFPWLNPSLEVDPDWLTPQVSLASIADDYCIVIPYSTLHEDCEMFASWYYAAKGIEPPTAVEG